MAKLTEIEGIGPVYTEKLQAANVLTQQDLLEKAGKPGDRKKLSDQTGIATKLMLSWANRADLARIKGIGEEYADLLECSGVDTVPELAQRNAPNLHAKLSEVNADKNLTRSLPGESQVANWIAQAKELPRAVFH